MICTTVSIKRQILNGVNDESSTLKCSNKALFWGDELIVALGFHSAKTGGRFAPG